MRTSLLALLLLLPRLTLADGRGELSQDWHCCNNSSQAMCVQGACPAQTPPLQVSPISYYSQSFCELRCKPTGTHPDGEETVVCCEKRYTFPYSDGTVEKIYRDCVTQSSCAFSKGNPVKSYGNDYFGSRIMCGDDVFCKDEKNIIPPPAPPAPEKKTGCCWLPPSGNQIDVNGNIVLGTPLPRQCVDDLQPNECPAGFQLYPYYPACPVSICQNGTYTCCEKVTYTKIYRWAAPSQQCQQNGGTPNPSITSYDKCVDGVNPQQVGCCRSQQVISGNTISRGDCMTADRCNTEIFGTFTESNSCRAGSNVGCGVCLGGPKCDGKPVGAKCNLEGGNPNGVCVASTPPANPTFQLDPTLISCACAQPDSDSATKITNDAH